MYNDQQDKKGQAQKNLKAKFGYSYVWLSWVLNIVLRLAFFYWFR